MIKRLRALWAKEPVLVAEVVPLAVTAGLCTQQQADTVQSVIVGVVAGVVQLLAAFGVRAGVTSPATAAKAAAAAPVKPG